MKTYKTLCFFLISFGILSAQGIKDFHSKTIELNLDKNSQHEAFFLSSITENEEGEFLWRYIKEFNKLEIYDLKELTLVEYINLSILGPDKTGHVFGFYPISDSEIILINLTGEIIHYDIHNGIIGKGIYLNDIDDINSLIVTSMNAKRVVFKRGDNIYLPVSPKNPNIYDVKNQFYLYLNHNLKSGTTSYAPYQFTDSFHKNGLKNLNYHSIYLPDSDELVILPMHTDDFMIFNCNNQLQVITASVKEIKKHFKNWEGVLEDDKEIINDFFEYSVNIGLMYDPFRKYIYKIFWPGAAIEKYYDKVSFEDIRRLRFPFFCIAIYDVNLNLKGVYKSPDFVYNSNQMFIGKRGLYIQADHPQNEKSEEDKIKFHVFEFNYN